jgi:hypothetical protein
MSAYGTYLATARAISRGRFPVARRASLLELAGEAELDFDVGRFFRGQAEEAVRRRARRLRERFRGRAR